MPADYVFMEDFVAVLTPHFITAWINRFNLRNGEMTTEFVYSIWDNAPMDTTVAILFGRGYIYARKKFNNIRFRLELEFISFTPSSFVHTKRDESARLITIK